MFAEKREEQIYSVHRVESYVQRKLGRGSVGWNTLRARLNT